MLLLSFSRLLPTSQVKKVTGNNSAENKIGKVDSSSTVNKITEIDSSSAVNTDGINESTPLLS